MIFIKDEVIMLEYNGNSYGFSKVEFGRRPRDVMGRIIDIAN